MGRVPPPIAQLGERETVDVADISMSPVRSRVGGLFIRLVPLVLHSLVPLMLQSEPLKSNYRHRIRETLNCFN